MKSLTQMKAHVISRLAGYLQFVTNTKKPTMVGNTRPIGGINATQTSDGVFYPTVQGAIDDLIGRCDLPINTVITNTDGVRPGFTSQSDQIKVTGIIEAPEGYNDGDEVIIKVFGYPVKVLVGDTDIAVASKIKLAIDDLIVANECFSSVVINTLDNTVLNITYNDYQNRVLPTYYQSGVTITQTIVAEAKAGYGQWEQQGTASVTLTGGSVNGPLTLYYFKRVS